MYTKIIGILICMLLIGTTLPIISSSYSEVNIKLQESTSNLPDYFNWKDYKGQDWTTPAKNQGSCGSCWIFASVAILESVINIKEGSSLIDPDLSEQYVLSCLPEAGNGCNGGFPYDVFSYIIDTSPSGNNCNGIIWESCFPYQADHRISCDDKCPEWEDYLIPIIDHGHWITDENSQEIEDIKTQIMQSGPVVACMLWTSSFNDWGFNNHDPSDYFPYYEGENGIDHDIAIIGWKDDESIGNGGYWICKNSYGIDFGYDGFFNLEYGLLGALWIDEDPDTTYIVWVDYDPESYEWPNEPNPPSKPNITGEISGNINSEYEYFFSSTDDDGDDIYYHINWGDDSEEEVIGPNPSGDIATAKHTWIGEGIYIIKAKAKDTTGLESDWAILEVSMPKNKALSTSFFLQKLIENFPFFEKILNQII
jgi:C1A family cysteine protease